MKLHKVKEHAEKIPANYWIHGEYLLIDGGKMSKSLGNVYLIKDIKDRGYDPIVYKLLCYSCSYRIKLNFTWEGMEATSKSLDRLRNGYKIHREGKEKLDEEDRKKLEEIEHNFHEAINDDMNMPLAMSYVWEAVRYSKKSQEVADLLLKFDTVLGLKIDKEPEQEDIEIPQDVLALMEQRKQARQEKNWAESDRLRDLIKEKGYEVKDTKDGMNISKI